MMIKPFGSIESRTGGFVEKEVRQHDNILLKRKRGASQSATTCFPTRT